jgi:hypothetical protein
VEILHSHNHNHNHLPVLLRSDAWNCLKLCANQSFSRICRTEHAAALLLTYNSCIAQWSKLVGGAAKAPDMFQPNVSAAVLKV